MARVATALNKQRTSVAKTVTEVGSGLNGHRAKLIALLKGPHVQAIAVGHRDRPMRLGAEYVEAALRLLAGGSSWWSPPRLLPVSEPSAAASEHSGHSSRTPSAEGVIQEASEYRESEKSPGDRSRNSVVWQRLLQAIYS
jgi:hypothetical protein